MHSVEPLGAQRGLPVEHHPALLEGTDVDRFDRLWWKLVDQDVVLCSHGDVIEALITDLQRGGVDRRKRDGRRGA